MTSKDPVILILRGNNAFVFVYNVAKIITNNYELLARKEYSLACCIFLHLHRQAVYFNLKKGTYVKTALIEPFLKVEEVFSNSDMKYVCNHLTSFGGGSLVSPNDIDFVKVIYELQSPDDSAKFLVLANLMTTFLLYLVAIVFAWREDRKVKVKVS